MAEKIYISNALEDKQLFPIIDELRKRNFIKDNDELFLDCDIKPGSNIRAMLRDNIAASNKVFIILSKEKFLSPWVNYEIGMADAFSKPVILIESKKQTSRLPVDLSNKQIVKINDDFFNNPETINDITKEPELRDFYELAFTLQKEIAGMKFELLKFICKNFQNLNKNSPQQVMKFVTLVDNIFTNDPITKEEMSELIKLIEADPDIKLQMDKIKSLRELEQKTR